MKRRKVLTYFSPFQLQTGFKMQLYIKNMVCNRCIAAVKNELTAMGLHPSSVTLGEAEIIENELSADQLDTIATKLKEAGFELIDDRKSRLVEKIKNIIIKLVHHSDEQPMQNLSDIISKELHLDYPYLSKLFSDIEGRTIEHYYINQKIEKVKEYLVYDELTLSEIADKMGYSSVAHLSAQFKKVTGLTPSHFKDVKENRRIALDEVGKKKNNTK